jgi:hypothetical protein
VCRLAARGGAIRHARGHNRPASTAPIRAAILSERARWPLTSAGAPPRAEPCRSVTPASFATQTTCCVGHHPSSCAAETLCHPHEASLLAVHQSPSSPKQLLQQSSCISSLLVNAHASSSQLAVHNCSPFSPPEQVPVQRPLLHGLSGSSAAMVMSERACHPCLHSVPTPIPILLHVSALERQRKG